ncbi:putative ATPase [Mycobacterium sp. BK086]|uniref:BTAD domain-containing putative transcriptional regulator n=1 Tax=Mycobacterium sp. BK086 TaxID=2512165 RepID=UPI00105DF488|nr:BTAD domain-containing putative transcriptional regulator [Mycobacterium sp. BK086]TDO17589.1 putative ATPase [Mycobacterium sp. BK086]
MGARFSLLGDVEVHLDGRPLDAGHARQRCVLAALLVDVNRSVSVDQLLDRVWADAPPRRARNALAGYVSRLRGLLAGVDGVSIGRGPGGYQLSTDPLSIDVHLFRQLASSARSTDDPVAATSLFDEALALWRGEPFAALDTPWILDVRGSLEVERLSVVLDRNDAALRAGRHHELLGELVTALAAHPLDERLAGQLMLAQYRSGRQAEALDTYRRMRDRLVEELGVDPGPSLRAVHQTILDGDEGARVEVPAQPVRTRPHAGLPRRATSFVGREQEVVAAGKALQEGPLVTLTGVGGVGKTRLALEAAGRDEHRFADGVWLCELAPVEDGVAVGHAVAAALTLQQRQGLSIDETLIEYLRAREVLLLIDNCEHVLDDAARLIDQIVRHCPRVSLLVTSREPLGIEGERIVAVPPLGVDEATELFVDRARAGRPDFDPDREPVGAVAEICRRLDGLPLAIELAAARMRAMSSLDVARRLDRLRLLSGGVRSAHPRHQSLAATIDWSYRLLADEEQALFAQLSVFVGGFDLAAAHGVCAPDGATEDDTLDLLSGLVDKSMVVVRSGPESARFTVLEMLRAFGRDKLRENGIAESCATRHSQYFTGLAENAAAGMHTPDERTWAERILPDYDNLRAGFECAMADGDVDRALRLVTSLPEPVFLRIGYEPALWAERVLGVAPPEHPLVPAAAGFAARGAWIRADHAAARAWASHVAGRVPGRGNGRIAYPGDVLADVALYEGDPETAFRHYEAEVIRARSENDPIRLVWTLFYMAICYAALRNPDGGLHAAEEACVVADGTANPTARSMADYAMGLVLKKSQPDRALALFDEAAELAASAHNFWWHGIALMEAASTRAVHGDPHTAAGDFVAVLDHWDRVGDWSQQWLNLRYVTRLLVRLGADEDAAVLHRALVEAGKPSPLSQTQIVKLGTGLGVPRTDALTGADAVARARASLRRLSS